MAGGSRKQFVVYRKVYNKRVKFKICNPGSHEINQSGTKGEAATTENKAKYLCRNEQVVWKCSWATLNVFFLQLMGIIRGLSGGGGQWGRWTKGRLWAKG